MSLLQIAGESYPRFVCETCSRESESQPNDDLLALGWRETAFQTYMCALCMRIGSNDRRTPGHQLSDFRQSFRQTLLGGAEASREVSRVGPMR